MNLIKINRALSDLIRSSTETVIPDVKQLYINLGYKYVGRHIYSFGESKHNTNYFNKSVVHKKLPCFIGKKTEGFYQETIIKPNEEHRYFIIKGRPTENYSSKELMQIVDKLFNTFGLYNYVLDVYSKVDNDKYIHKVGGHGLMIMEINELHLSSITPEELNLIFKQIL